MREILFRGKLTDNSKWVYGCLLDKIYGAVPAIMSEQSVDDAFNLEFEYDHVQEKTVGQYTGMKDKNGKQIFEGDIVKVLQGKDKGIACVGFESGTFMLYPITGNIYERTLWAYWYNDWDVEVVGNIHDNPELLENP